MFTGLLDFDYRRTGRQAIGFYLFYLLLTIVASAIAGGLTGLFVAGGVDLGIRVGTFVAVIVSLALSAAVLSKRGRFAHPGYVLLSLVCALGALFAGGLVGIVAPAFLSTREGQASAEE